MRGRRKPIEQHVIEGTYRRDRHGELSPDDLPAPLPPKPKALKGRAGKVWDELVPLLAGIVKPRDVMLLTEVCRWVARMEKWGRDADRIAPTAPKAVQVLTGAGICTTKLKEFSALFGFSPLDRAKLRTDTPEVMKPRVPTRPRTKLDLNGKPK